MSTTETIVVHILDKEYPVACPPQEREALARAASELNRRMLAIRQSGAVIGLERIAVMAALNLAYEVNQLSEKSSEADQNLVNNMCQQIETILTQ